MEKTQWIRHIDAGDEVRSLFLVSAASQLQAKNGPFWKLELKDASGSLEARIWSPASQTCPDLRAGSLAEVEGRAESYRDQLQLNVGRLRLLTPEETEQADLAAFLPAGDRPAAELLEEAEALCRRELTHKPWRTFALAVLGDPEIRPRLLTATAAKGVHHAWVGGLLEHSLSVATLCLRLCDHYPELDRQTLFTGALFHDIGKISELSGGLANDYTDEGRLVGHINLGLELLAPHLKKARVEPELALHFRHLVLSHHGQYEYGSPRLPQTAEALTLHYADNLDAKLAQARALFRDMNEGESAWSPYQRTLDRALYQAPRTPRREKPRAEPAPPRDDQCSLLG